MVEDKSKLEKLKKNYSLLQKEHNLPSFEEMNEDFHIEKIAETETDILSRELRKMVGEKIMNYMRFVENLLNPVNVPMSIFTIVKMINSEDKKRLSRIFKELIKIEVRFIERDLKFDEKKDLKFIKDSFNVWQKIKKELLRIFGNIDEKWEEKFVENSKGYFG